MTNFIHLADCHLGYNQYGLDERSNDFMSNFKKVISEDCDFFLISGDIFHKRQVGPKTLTEMMEILRTAVLRSIPVFVIPGNHDKIFTDGMTWLGALEYFRLIKLINNGFEDFRDFRIFGFTTWDNYIKYGPLPIRKGAKNIMMLHEAVEGYIPDTGVKLDDIQSIKKCGIDYLALGHVHTPYDIGGWIYNPGSVERTKVSDGVGGYYFVKDNISNVEHIKFKVRPIHKITVDVTNKTDAEIKNDIANSITKSSLNSILSIKFEGRIDRIFNARDFSPTGFFHVIISNETTFKSAPITGEFSGNVETEVIKHMTTGREDIRKLIFGLLAVPDANQDEIISEVEQCL